MIRTHSELVLIPSFYDRFKYLSLGGNVGEATFGFDRYLNQRFYRSVEWRRLRQDIIYRDNGCDLGVPGYEIHSHLVIHHMNPMRRGDDLFDTLNTEYLITTSFDTHNAIHYGDESYLNRKVLVSRRARDTNLW